MPVSFSNVSRTPFQGLKLKKGNNYSLLPSFAKIKASSFIIKFWLFIKSVVTLFTLTNGKVIKILH